MAKRLSQQANRRYFDDRSLPEPVREGLARTGLAVQRFASFESTTGEHSHGHSFVEMVYLVSGRLRHRLQSVSAEDGAGMLSVVHVHQRHRLEAIDGPVDLYNIYVDLRRHRLPPLPEGLGRELAGLLPMHPVFGYRPPQVARVEIQCPEAIESALAALAQEQQRRRPGSRAAVSLHTQLFWLECSRSARACGLQAAHMPDDAGDACAERARQKLDGDLQRPWRLDNLADEVGTSQSYLSRRFRKYTGKTVVEYLTARRIERAMLLLQTTDRKVLDIALACGFGDLSHFNRTFRRHVHASPTGYRKSRL